MSVTRLADIIGYSKAALSRYETCASPVPEELCPKLDATFGTENLFTGMFEMLRGVRFPDRYLEYMALEEMALALGEYAAHTVPGLLQTPAYAAALFRAYDLGATDEEIETRVENRMSRRRIFGKDPHPYFTAVLDEAVLRRWIGGPAVMAEQLAALLPMMDHEYGAIQVLPFRHGAHATIGGTLIMITLEDGLLAYLEGSKSGQILEDPDVVTARQRAYDRLSAHALSPGDSAVMIRAAIEEFETHARNEAQRCDVAQVELQQRR